MKYILLALLYFVALNFTIIAQPIAKHTQLLIIGTKHNGNKYITFKTIYAAIKKYQPNIILWEQHVKFKKVFGLSTIHFFKIAKPSLEQLAIQKYLRYNKQVKVYPFDTTFNRLKYIAEFTTIDGAINNGLNNIKMAQPDSLVYAAWSYKNNVYANVLNNNGLDSLNKPTIFNMAKILKALDTAVILPLAKKYLNNSTLIYAFEQRILFWNARNLFMVNQIKKYITQFEDKKILVITGLSHKYFLVNELK